MSEKIKKVVEFCNDLIELCGEDTEFSKISLRINTDLDLDYGLVEQEDMDYFTGICGEMLNDISSIPVSETDVWDVIKIYSEKYKSNLYDLLKHLEEESYTDILGILEYLDGEIGFDNEEDKKKYQDQANYILRHCINYKKSNQKWFWSNYINYCGATLLNIKNDLKKYEDQFNNMEKEDRELFSTYWDYRAYLRFLEVKGRKNNEKRN